MRITILSSVFAAALLASPAAAQWSQKQLTGFVEDCVAACNDNAKVHSSQKGKRRPYCNCVAADGQKIFTEADFDEMTRDLQAGKKTQKLTKFNTLAPVCSKRVFSN